MDMWYGSVSIRFDSIHQSMPHNTTPQPCHPNQLTLHARPPANAALALAALREVDPRLNRRLPKRRGRHGGGRDFPRRQEGLPLRLRLRPPPLLLGQHYARRGGGGRCGGGRRGLGRRRQRGVHFGEAPAEGGEVLGCWFVGCVFLVFCLGGKWGGGTHTSYPLIHPPTHLRAKRGQAQREAAVGQGHKELVLARRRCRRLVAASGGGGGLLLLLAPRGAETELDQRLEEADEGLRAVVVEAHLHARRLQEAQEGLARVVAQRGQALQQAAELLCLGALHGRWWCC